MSQIITGNFFGSDRIDYLLRDAKSTGVSYGLFDYHQLIEMLCIGQDGQNLVLAVEENGLEACEALLLARHFMHKRVYQYPTVQAYSFHMARFMEKLYERHKPTASLESYLAYTDNEVLVEARKAFLDKKHESHEDAAALFARENRYLAIALPDFITEEKVADWKKRNHILDKYAEAHFSFTPKESGECSFFVMQEGKLLSKPPRPTLFVPPFSVNWLYVSSSYQDVLSDLLGS
jgi:HD superfamily phosphohydrolase